MERGISDKNVLEEFAIEVCSIVERYCRYIIVSGFVVIASGRTRATEDIDMIIERISKERFIEMHNELDNLGFECLQSSKPEEIYEYLENGDGIRYVRKGSYSPPEMEIKFAKDELDEIQLRTRRKLNFTGLDIWFSSVDMNIAFKEELLKSPKDMEDARHLRLIYKEDISEEEIDKIKSMIRRLRLRDGNREGQG